MPGDETETGTKKPEVETSGGAGGGAKVRREVMVRTVLEMSARDWPQLTRTNYDEWAVLMKWKLKARHLWVVMTTGVGEEDKQMSAMDALLSSTSSKFHEAIGRKQSAHEAWKMLESYRVGSDRARKAKIQQLRKDFNGAKFHHDESMEDFALRLERLVSQMASLGKKVKDEILGPT